MRIRILALLSALLALGVLSTTASGTSSLQSFATKLNIAQEVPKEKGAPMNAGGTFTATLNGTTLKWKLTFSHLTGPATAAHIHVGKMGKAGPVLVPLCGPCKSPASGTVKLTASAVKAIDAGGIYVNVHTAKNPNGEIRGQIGM